MNYQLHREGQNLGEFSVEELRRRRAAGELTGTEFVRHQGMPDWQPLDAVLKIAALESRPITPPPLPASAMKHRSRRILILAVVSGVLLGLTIVLTLGILAVKRWQQAVSTSSATTPANSDAVAVASRPVVWATNSLTTADLAKGHKEFRARQWVAGYQLRGRHDQPCDAEVLQFLETWLARNYGDPVATNLPSTVQWADQLAAQPGCEDPLLLTIAGVTSIELNEEIRRLERALKGFENSRHKAYPKFYATVSLANAVRDRPARVRTLDAAAVQLLREAFADESLLAQDQAEMGDVLLDGWGHTFFQRNGAAVYAVAAESGKSFEWLALVLQGEHHIQEAWKARGSGFANTVTEQGWKGFRDHLAEARRYLTQAWKLQPEQPLAACRMIYVALGESDFEEMRLWFDRTVAAQIDNAEAWSHLRWGLRPRWYGDPEAMLAFGVTAVNTGRFDTDVPRKFMDVVADLESEASLPPGQHLLGRSDIWPQVQRMYEGYLAAQTRPGDRHGWRSPYAVAAYLAGKYDVARTQLEALQWQPDADSLRGWGRELSLFPLEVAARTSPLGEPVALAERSRRHGDIADALRRFTELKAAASADTRTQDFLRYRLASLEIERRLQDGEWVDMLPAADHDPNWVFATGEAHRLADGALEVQAGPAGHFLFCRARIGLEFEVKGEFEVVRSSTKDFQAGLVMGLPERDTASWCSFRMKRNATDGQIASFAAGWSKPQTAKPVVLTEGRNLFQARFQAGGFSASVNGVECLRQTEHPRIRVAGDEFLFGLGAFNDMNETVLRYRNVQVRRFTASGAAVNK